MGSQKKVGTITFHIAHNYGAMLQAYALPIAVQMLGYDCEVIDYRFPYIYQWGKVENLEELISVYGFIGGSLRWMKRLLLGMYFPWNRRNIFNEFRDMVIPHSEKPYFSKDELKDLEYDAIMFGSDQIWNSELTDGVATEFVGGFPHRDDMKLIAYAASCGRVEFNEDEKKAYYPLLNGFSAISVREKGFADFLRRDGFYVERVLDPTLLLSCNDWDKMVTRTKSYIRMPKKKYILVYVFDEQDTIYDFINKIAMKSQLEVVVIAYERKPIIKKYHVYTRCGPGDFVHLIAQAQMVVTTSFHGTVFSILYHKEFYCIPHPKYHERTDSLLELTGLQERNVNGIICNKKVTRINWTEVEKRLEVERMTSLKYIKDAIG